MSTGRLEMDMTEVGPDECFDGISANDKEERAGLWVWEGFITAGGHQTYDGDYDYEPIFNTVLWREPTIAEWTMLMMHQNPFDPVVEEPPQSPEPSNWDTNKLRF